MEPAKRRNLPSLTGARWWAALAVFALHAVVFLPVYPFQKSDTFRVIHSWIPMQQGAAGVTFFFVLSGFVICWSFDRVTSVGRYFVRRVAKLYPTHLVTTILLVCVATVPLARLVVWLPNVLLIHAWVPKWTTVGGLNVPSWSLCSELLFYASFPLAWPLLRRIPVRYLPRVLITGILLVLAIHVLIFLLVPDFNGTQNVFAPRLLPGDQTPAFEIHASPQWFAQPDIPVLHPYWLSYDFPLTRLPEFYVGAVVALMVRAGQWRLINVWRPLVVLLGAYLLTWFVPLNMKMSALLVGPMAVVIGTIANRDLHGRGGLNSRPIMQTLGNISFAFYMVQFPVMVAITRFALAGHEYGIRGWLGAVAASFVLSVALAALIYYGIDKPIMQRVSRPKPKSADDAAPDRSLVNEVVH